MRPIVYFHGFNSSSKSDKVMILRDEFPSVFSFEIDIDPLIAESFLKESIDSLMLVRPIFVGTSLGGYWASRMAAYFPDASLILINPAYDPKNQLVPLDSSLSEELLSRYEPIDWELINSSDAYLFIAEHDEVTVPDYAAMKSIDHIKYYSTASHRFNGPEFLDVINAIRSLQDESIQ